SFEYLANPQQILKGRAIVGGVLIVYSLLSAFLPFVEVVFLAGFTFAFPWLVTRALAFNARHSAWRNIRFGFSSSYKEALKVYTLWPALAMLTLGVLAPYAFYRQRRFLVENSSFGRTGFSFQATGRDYYRIFMGLSLWTIAAIALIAGAVMVSPLFAILVLPIYLCGFAFFAVKSGNLFYNASRPGGHRLASVMEVKGYAWLVLTNTLLTALTLGFFHPWARVRTTNYRVHHLSLVPSGDLESFVAGEQAKVGALGDASADLFDFDFGL
nr:YjgN family protein [Desulfobacterales bacterium]